MLTLQPCDPEVVQAACGTVNDCQCRTEADLKRQHSPDQHSSETCLAEETLPSQKTSTELGRNDIN